MNDPLISVVVPIYNVKDYLRQCIESIVKQTYSFLEIILVDDGSTDGCSVICDEYASIDDRVIVVHKENGGLDSARKAGVSLANGDYVGYVDGDDWIEPTMYEMMAQAARDTGASTIVCGIIDNYGDRERPRAPYLQAGFYDKETFNEKIEPRILYAGTFFRSCVTTSLCDKIFKREVLIKYQMRTGLNATISDDTMVIIPAVIEGKTLYVLHDCFYHYRMRENSLKHKKQSIDQVAIIKRWLPTWEESLFMASSSREIMKQLYVYLIYQLAMKDPKAFDKKANLVMNVYGGIECGSKIIIYGAGQTGIRLSEYANETGCVDVVAWTDRDYDKMPQEYGLCSPEKAISKEFDYLIIAILREDAYLSARQDIEKLGVQKRKIRWMDNRYIDCAEKIISQMIEDYEEKV